MIGLIVFHLLTAAFVWANVLTDRGLAEQRRNKAGYERRLVAMAEFERNGGRVQGIEEHSVGVRRMMRKYLVIPWAISLLLAVGMTAFGVPIWVPATIIAVYVAVSGAMSWFVSEMFGLADGRAPRSKPEIAGAVIALGLKGAMVVAGICAAGQGISDVNKGAWLSGVALMVLALALLTYCYLPVAVIDRHLQKMKEVDFAARTKTGAVLFLRSFGDDNLRMYSPYGSIGPRYRFIPGRKRLEEVLASVLTRHSEFVSVGKPGEKLPMLGASRTYWDHDNWKDAIKSTASRTSALLVLAGKTPSLSWEMSQLSELGLLGKTLILFPPDDDAGTISRYSYIDEALKFETHLPDELKLMITAIAFDESGRPVHYISGGRDWSSYVAALLHYQLVLDGDIQFEAEGMASEVLASTEDPFEQAAYLLMEHKKGTRESDRADTDALVKEILSEVDIEPSDPHGLIGRAWQRVALHDDFSGARELLSSPGVEHGPMIERALLAINAVEGGADSREILRARRPERFHDQPAQIWRGNAQFGRIEALQFQRIMQRIGSAEDAQDREAVYSHSMHLLEFAKTQGSSTVIAMAQVQLGEAEIERGNLERAATLFKEAKRLRDAPKVQLSPLLPKLEPIEVVEEALNGLVRVADAENNVFKRNAALRELLALHTDYGAPEDAAAAAEQAGLSHANAGDLKTARSYFEQAYSTYTKVGRLAQAGWVTFLQAKAESQQDNYDEALSLLKNATKIAVTADDSVLGFETNKLAGDIQWKRASKSSDKNVAEEAKASYRAALEAARAEVQVASQKGVAPEKRRESYLNLSVALIDLGIGIEEDDAVSARGQFQEAVGIRRTLVAENPEDYWTARRLGFSLLYLAENARKLQVDEGPTNWAEAVSQFSTLTKNLADSNTAAQDLSIAIIRFEKKHGTNPSKRAELEAMASVVPAIEEALRNVVEHASPADAFKVTCATVGLATEFDGVSMRSTSHDLFAATLDARRRLSNESPDHRMIRRGLAFSLINTHFGLLPENSDSALSNFHESVSIFEDLAASADAEALYFAKSDLITGLRYSAELLGAASHPAARDFNSRTVEVARQLIDLAPEETRWKEDLAWALLGHADAIPKEDTVAALGGYQAVLDLDVSDGFPAGVRWLALVRSGRLLEVIDPNEASRFFNKSVQVAKAELAVSPGDEEFEWRLARSLCWEAETMNTIDPVSALATWRECIEVQKRRLLGPEKDVKEIQLLVVALTNAAELLGSADIETAAGLYRDAIPYVRELITLDPDNPQRLRDAVAVGEDLAELLSRSNPPSHDAAATWEQVKRDALELATLTELTPHETELLRKAASFAAVTSEDASR